MIEMYMGLRSSRGFVDVMMEIPAVKSVVADRDNNGDLQYIVHLESKLHYDQLKALFDQARLLLPPPTHDHLPIGVGTPVHYVCPPQPAGV